MTTIMPLSEGSTMISQAKRELNDKDEQHTHSGPSAGCEQQPSIGTNAGFAHSIAQQRPHADASQLAAKARCCHWQPDWGNRARALPQRDCEAYFCVCEDQHTEKDQSVE